MSKNRGKSKLSKNVLFNVNKHVFHCEKSLGTFFYGQPLYNRIYKVQEVEKDRACNMQWKKRNAYRVSVAKLEELNVGGRIILRCILEERDEVIWPGLIWLRTGPVEVS
jgi:hypothetical protein